MNKNIVLIILSITYLTPVAFVAAQIGKLPIEIVLSDVLLVYLVFAVVSGNKLQSNTITVWIILLYFPFIAFLSYFQNRTGIGTVASMVNFWMPTFHIFLGSIFFKKYGESLFLVASYYVIFLIFVIFASDVILGPFPRGCGYEGRWGGCIGGLDIYGFPNASMVFLVTLSTLVIYLYNRSNKFNVKILCLSSLLLLFIMVTQSLSKSSLLSIVLLTLLWVYTYTPVKYIILTTPFIGFALLSSYELILSSNLLAGVQSRVIASLDNGDLSTGRLDIWLQGWDLVKDRPLFGYQFDLISRYGFDGTVHQQYLELLYKTGFIGFFIYIGLFLYALYRLLKISKYNIGLRKNIKVIIFFFILTMINNLFQSFTNYSPMANLIFFILGIILTVSNSPSNHSKTKQNKSMIMAKNNI